MIRRVCDVAQKVSEEILPKKELNTMTVEQIRDYTALVKRRSELIRHSGISWKPEYEQELQSIDRKLAEFRKG